MFQQTLVMFGGNSHLCGGHLTPRREVQPVPTVGPQGGRKGREGPGSSGDAAMHHACVPMCV